MKRAFSRSVEQYPDYRPEYTRDGELLITPPLRAVPDGAIAASITNSMRGPKKMTGGGFGLEFRLRNAIRRLAKS
jgi:hypothetical protein